LEADDRKPSDDDLLISTTYTHTGAYVIIALDETIDQQMVLFVPEAAEAIGDRRVKVLERNLTVAESLRVIADKIADDLKDVPKSTQEKEEAVKRNGPAKRGGAGPQKTSDPDAPWGRLADGTPKQKPGRRAAEPPPKSTPAKKAAASKRVPANGATKAPATRKRTPAAK